MPNASAPMTWLESDPVSARRAKFLDKALVDNPLAQALLNAAYPWGSQRVNRLSLMPGRHCFFWGYRALHTHQPCDADAIRATARLHYGGPHVGTRFEQMLRRH
ncbi:hypothetical protein ACRAWG_37315 [Methylobacterium sp. P31]